MTINHRLTANIMTQKIDHRIDKHKATLHRVEHLTKDQLDYLSQSKDEQEKSIARIYCAHPKITIGPTVIHHMMFPNFPRERGNWPITSTRRAINNLTKAGILVKTAETSDSLLDGIEHLWRWRKPMENIQNKPMTHAEIVQMHHENGQMNFYEQMFGRNEK